MFIRYNQKIMYSLSLLYLQSLQFSETQLSTLKKIGEYKGKQELFMKQIPETLSSLQQQSLNPVFLLIV